MDEELCWRAVQAQDRRFDGWFVLGVITTGVYCRPGCPARTPLRHNVRFHPTAAAAQAAGFRACKRCRPDASPGSPAWDGRSDLVARANRLIADGVVDRGGVPELARRLGYNRRQVERALRAELGAGPLALARAQRAQTARILLETTGLGIADVAFAAGFGSVRQFHSTVHEVFASRPGELRSRARSGRAATPGTVQLRLPIRIPLWPDSLFGHLVATAVPGVEQWRDGAYRRTLRLPFGVGIVALRPPAGPSNGAAHVACRLSLTDLRDLAPAVARCRRLLDLDADPIAVDERLAQDEALAPYVAKAPGRRVPRTVDAAELALRTVLGQQVSTAAARTHARRLVLACGEPIDDPEGGLTHLFPTPAAVAGVDPAVLALPRTRRASLLRLAQALADGQLDLDPGTDWNRVRAQLHALPGIGPWTVETIAMRGLGDPDTFLPGDLGVALAARTLELGRGRPLLARAGRWAPYRSYAVQLLWAVGEHAINTLPIGDHP
ncbi:MAG: helix-turn-helix domain-containing protein [Actinobacteria bacterium]|nr:helix-turn-helix domain-containing protein [Actinomycetota bacterium]MBW3646351.1 helix-turn-helix domain-containing protein [Actinomycetota bacterium]